MDKDKDTGKGEKMNESFMFQAMQQQFKRMNIVTSQIFKFRYDSNAWGNKAFPLKLKDSIGSCVIPK